MSVNNLIEALPAPRHKRQAGAHMLKAAAAVDAGEPNIPIHVVDPNVPLYEKVQKEGLNSIGKSNPKNIIVVGAGMAGLSAAYELQRAGHHVTVLEAQNHPGGRVHTVREAFYLDYAEAGAMRLPKAHKCVNNYVDILKLPTEVFSGFDPKGFYYLFGQTWNIGEYTKNPLPMHEWLAKEHNYEFNPEMLDKKHPKGIADMWETVYQNLLKEAGYGNKPEQQQKAWEYLCSKYDMAFGDYLTQHAGWKSGTMELFGLIGSGIGGYQSTYISSFLENIREEISLREDWTNPDSVHFTEIVGGNDQLPYALANPLNKKLILGATLTKIRDNHAAPPPSGVNTKGRRYTVTYRISNSNVECQKSCDYLLITIPFTALRTVQVTPAWPTTKAQAIRELHYQFASKVMLEFNKRWWNDPKGPIGMTAGGALSTDLMLRNVYFPDHSADTGRGVVLASYTWEDDALWWASKSRDQQVTEALAQLHQFISAIPEKEGQKKIDIRRYFSGGDIKSWSLDPIVSGAYAFFNPGQMSEIFSYITENVGHIFFAGEHASFDHAWIEGAIQSGIREAIRIHKLPDGGAAAAEAVASPSKKDKEPKRKDSSSGKEKKEDKKEKEEEHKDDKKDKSKDKDEKKDKSKDKEKEKEKEKSKEKSKSKSK